MAFAEVAGVRLFYETHGAGEAVLFIHGGYGGPSTTLLPAPEPPIVRALRDECRVITYDRRCAGRSDYRHDQLSLEDLAADAAGLLDALDVERVILVGSSAGGPIALQFALTRPERVIGLALPNTGPALMSETPTGFGAPYPPTVARRLERARHFIAQVQGARAVGDATYFRNSVDDIRDPPLPPGSEPPAGERAEALQAALRSANDEELFTTYIGMLRNYEAYIGVDLTERLAELTMPVFIVHGNEDLAVPLEYGELLNSRIAHSELRLIEGAGHGILAYPEAMDAMCAWVRTVAA